MNGRDELFGKHRLKQSIEEDAKLPAGRFCDALLRKLESWAGTGPGQTQADDVTLVVVDFKRAGDSLGSSTSSTAPRSV